jgi:hypothetical protein
MQRQGQRQPQPQYYTAIIQRPDPDPDRLSKLLELGDPDFFGCYISNRREANMVKVKSAAATAIDVPKLSNASITGEQKSERLKKLLDLGDPSFFGGGR